MRALLRTGAWVVLAVIVGCARAPERPANPGGHRVAQADVELKVESVTREADTLAVTYAVHNRTSRAVLLVDGLWDVGFSGHLTLAPERAYVDLSGGRVVLSRMLLPVPEDLMVEAPEVPAVSRVEAGATANRRAVVPLPLRTALPYPTGPEETRELPEVREVFLRVGYLPDADAMTLHAGKDSQGTAVQTPEYGPVVKAQRVLDSGPLPVSDAK
ncbi:hypothetical protein [Corallococcus terminator]|uniref:Uncharacterized protein n=1 Tax=Corallococcus terminator TaxID=2316733 RepID=A0A3A8I9N4_9BACT|nr:hypothetical protein [Corallococcus terminator]RKG80179.1 hypothetical protein D7V88_27825 [Corallococcus terminator]